MRTHSTFFQLVILGLFAGMLASCFGRGERDQGDDTGRQGSWRQATGWGGYTVDVRPVPAPIEVGRPFGLEVHVVRGRTDREIVIRVDAGMPEHAHGMNLLPRVDREGDATFLAHGLLFHMPGAWEIYVDVTHDGETERATFEVTVEG